MVRSINDGMMYRNSYNVLQQLKLLEARALKLLLENFSGILSDHESKQ
jgi:hypothetical protein